MELQVGVKILLKNKDNKYLIIKRNENKYKTKGSWDIPGGRIVSGETLLNNLKREVKEETNLNLLGEPRLIQAQDILLKDRHIVRLTFSGVATGEITLDLNENVEFKWLEFGEMMKHEYLDVYLKEVLERFHAKL